MYENGYLPFYFLVCAFNYLLRSARRFFFLDQPKPQLGPASQQLSLLGLFPSTGPSSSAGPAPPPSLSGRQPGPAGHPQPLASTTRAPHMRLGAWLRHSCARPPPWRRVPLASSARAALAINRPSCPGCRRLQQPDPPAAISSVRHASNPGHPEHVPPPVCTTT